MRVQGKILPWTILAVALAMPVAGAAQEQAGLTAAEKIYAELASLPKEERAKKIEEGARAEEEALVFVHTWRGKLARDHVHLFTERYPFMNVEFVDIGSQDAAERLAQEEAAGRHLTDVVSLSLGDMGELVDIAAQYETPITDNILPKYETLKSPEHLWVPFYWSEHGISYNSDMLSAEQAPKSWQDLCKPEYKGLVSFDPPEIRFLLGVYELMGEDIYDWMKCIGENDPIVQRGHTQRLQLMLAGDHPIQGDNYLYKGMQTKVENPSTPFQPVWTAPVFASGGVILINKHTEHPYGAALLADWTLSEESQKYTSDEYRGPLTLPHPYMPEEAETVIVPTGDAETQERLLDSWTKYVMRGEQ